MVTLDYIKGILAENGLSAILITNPANIFYTSNFSSPEDAIALITLENQYLITDTRYEIAAEFEVFEDFEIVIARDISIYMAARKLMAKIQGQIAFEDGSLSVKNYNSLQRRKLTKEGGRIVDILREMKMEEEIINIELAARLTDEAYMYALTRAKAGVSERKIALQIEYFIRDHGGELAFPPIVAAGKNSALPHAIPSNYCLTRGDILVMDLGAKINGYCADLTRTVAIEKASERARDFYNICYRANMWGIKHVKAGVCTRFLHDTAHSIIVDSGLSANIKHSLGHGVGLLVHEAPTIGRQTASKLHAGNVITIEPGIYVEGAFGIRIEDLVLVTKTGCRLLSNAEKPENILVV